MEQAIEKQEEQKPTRRKKEKKGMPMLLQLVLLVECEANELDKRLFPDMKITVLAYRTDKGKDGEPADRIVAKTLNDTMK